MPGLAPFLVSPVLVERPWGGSRLAGDTPDAGSVRIGESWQIADLPDGVANGIDDPNSRVASGPYAGAALNEIVRSAGTSLLGPIPLTPEGRFPLLFKLLDAREHLSVQVHPDARYVAGHPDARLKAESWYVIDADPGSVVYLDVDDGVDAGEVRDALGTDRLVPLLGVAAAERRQFHHVPAGLIHALGAGIVVAEIQTPSDTTFRLYDWAREYARAPRPLHIGEGAASVVLRHPEAFSRPAVDSVGCRHLIDGDHYWMNEHVLQRGTVPLSRSPGPTIVHVISGLVGIGDIEVADGATAIVPASWNEAVVDIERDTTFLEIGAAAL